MRLCWCGNGNFASFSPQYGKCKVCGTLVSLESLSDEQLAVDDDETDFYGKQYWLNHQQQDLGFPDIYARARNDLVERNLYWLKTLLKYRLPPADSLELGCGHGSFVALMQKSGYRASGVEMSPWVVAFGRKTFGVPIHVGPVENLDLPKASLDVIALMDVLEHLPNPIATMRHCMDLLKPDGFLLIQTPEFREDISYEFLLDSHSPFLEQLKSDEHLHLFSKQSVTNFLEQIGAKHIYFEPAIFSHYDMFLIAGGMPLESHNSEQTESALLETPSGRIALALLDLREKELILTQKLQDSENDRAERLQQIHTLTHLLKEAEVTNSKLKSTITGLKSTITGLKNTIAELKNTIAEQIESFEKQITILRNQLSNPFVKLSLKLSNTLKQVFTKNN